MGSWPTIQRKPDQSWSERKKDIPLNLLKMLGPLAAAILVSEVMRELDVGNQSLLLIYVLPVIVTARFTSGYIYALVGSVLSTLAYDFFITDPIFGFSFSFTIGSPITILIMFMITFMISALTTSANTQTELAQDRLQRAKLLYEINQKLLAVLDVSAVISLVEEYAQGNTKRRTAVFTADPLQPDSEGGNNVPDSMPALFREESVLRRVHRVFISGAEEPDDLTEEEHVRLFPVISKGKVYAVVALDCLREPLTPGMNSYMKMLAGQAALAMELHDVAQAQGHIQLEAERQKMHNNLLRAISHDLRTPLTSILGTASTLREQADLPREMRANLVADIEENAEWLIRVVENVLTVTRISSDNMHLKKTMEAAEEVVSQSAAIIRKRFPDSHIHIRIPDELIMVPMDATLISQVLINLMENAIKSCPDENAFILLDLSRQGHSAKFDISDNGPGIPDYLLDTLFESHPSKHSKAADSVRGMGIGLSICQTIIHAHHGTIEGKNRKEGGAKFTFLLPMEENPS